MARITALSNGPLLIEGDDAQLLDANGAEYKIAKRPFALCRCGSSQNKPFCDGSHTVRGFRSVDAGSMGEL